MDPFIRDLSSKDLAWLYLFLSDRFITKRIDVEILKSILFGTEGLIEEEYLDFRNENGFTMDLEQARQKVKGFKEFESILEQLSSFVRIGKYSTEQLHQVIFSHHYFFEGKIIFGNN